jgi:hypothetical protein
MADDNSKSGKPPAPSFYSAAAGMNPPPGDKGPKSAGAGTPEGQAGEKVKNVKVLLEVFEKMDKMEQDPEAKTLIQQMADMAKQYMTKLEGGKTDKPGAPATGEAGSGAGAPPPPPAPPGGGAPEMNAGPPAGA